MNSSDSFCVHSLCVLRFAEAVWGIGKSFFMYVLKYMYVCMWVAPRNSLRKWNSRCLLTWIYQHWLIRLIVYREWTQIGKPYIYFYILYHLYVNFTGEVIISTVRNLHLKFLPRIGGWKRIPADKNTGKEADRMSTKRNGIECNIKETFTADIETFLVIIFYCNFLISPR